MKNIGMGEKDIGVEEEEEEAASAE